MISGENVLFKQWNYKKLSIDYEKVARKRKELLKHYFWLCSGTNNKWAFCAWQNCDIGSWKKFSTKECNTRDYNDTDGYGHTTE